MKTTRTPGPWTLKAPNMHHKTPYVTAPDEQSGGNILVANEIHISANARLISAAPELLEAALEAIAVIRNPEAQETVNKLRAAIQKATGEA